MKVRGQSEGAFGAIEGSELRRLGRFAGALMIVGALVSVPAGLVLEPMPEAGVAVFSDDYAFFYVLVAMYARG